MFVGPVFRAELVRTARRRRYYLLRVAYGFALLLLIWANYLALVELAEERGGTPSIANVADFAIQTFVSFAVFQLATILVLVPPLFGAVIADEKQRKTIHYLMASQLSSGEIVFDKLGARLLHIAVFVLLGLPVISFLSLFGGVAWEYVVVAYVGTFSTTFFAAAMATLVSTLVRRVRQGVVIAYVLEIAWLILPAIADPICRFAFPGVYPWFKPFNSWALATSPIFPFGLAMSRGRPPGAFMGRGAAALLDPFLWMVGLQVVAGLCVLLLAVVQLRPTFRRQEASSRRLNWFGSRQRLPRWMRRPECGDDAMLWKERYCTRTDVFTKLFVLPATILLTVGVILVARLDEKVVRGLKELVHAGYGSPSLARTALNGSLRAVSAYSIGLWLLAVAGAAASSVTVEREEDTWVSLLSTPLSGWEILRGKGIGAVWGLRGLGVLLGLFWLIALAVGGVHPVGFLVAVLIVAMLTWFVVALGVYASLSARSTSRALTTVIVIMVFLNGGYLVVLEPILMLFSDPDAWTYSHLGCTPYLAANTLFSFDYVAQLRSLARVHRQSWLPLTPPLVYGSLILTGYAIAAAILTRRVVQRFDVVTDRPR